ncbi:MAG: hypothetical protein Ct9H300mP12_11410 [Acidimicrobiales bacterium]|nr:MAG: hypothetical protein Ct9H300mP12_11410 [Acidimicrobiales bacterium]
MTDDQLLIALRSCTDRPPSLSSRRRYGPGPVVSGGEGDGALDAEPTVERWRVVVVALATVAALPLFVLENPSSPGALTGTADAATRPLADASRMRPSSWSSPPLLLSPLLHGLHRRWPS